MFDELIDGGHHVSAIHGAALMSQLGNMRKTSCRAASGELHGDV
jgi:hypothetical protein